MRVFSLILIVVAIFLSACGDKVTSYEWPLRPGFPVPTVPVDNPMTLEKIELGRFLFYDKRLSGNQTQACASCHKQANAFSDDRTRVVGSTGAEHRRNSLALVNVAYNTTLTWAHPGLETIERQLLIPMFGEEPVELGITGSDQTVLDRFKSDELFLELFQSAFPMQKDPINFDNIIKALASFVRSLVSMNTPFDRYAYDEIDDALTQSQLRGMDLFLSESLECHHCHGGFNFTQSTTHRDQEFLERPMHNTGLYNVDGQGAYPPTDPGVIEITGSAEDKGKFRAPTLRNIALTGPYMHDGSIESLEQVIRFYESGGRQISSGAYVGDGRLSSAKSEFVRGFTLTDQERQDVIDFLHALTDEEFINNPKFSNPF